MKNLIPILDNGHGGMINGNYQTYGKRSPDWGYGVIYEGALNRWIVNRVIEKLDNACIPYFHASPELRDVGLGTRCARANRIQRKHKNAYFLSIHFNAGGGSGIEGFTSKGDTPSDPICEEFLKDLENNFPEEKMRFDRWSDGDRDKEKSYKVLTGVIGKSILLELGFMDNQSDYEKLNYNIHRENLADSLVGTISKLYNNEVE